MTGIFLGGQNEIDTQYEGFYDGQNKTIPNDTELNVAVTDGFVGIEEGKSLQVCVINIVVTSEGEFFGQKYKYNAKIFDQDASKRDLAMRNLGVLDAQAGFPMTNGQLELTTENIQEYWAGQSEARVKFGLFMTDPEGEPDNISREINFVRGFGYDRDKMITKSSSASVESENPAPQAVQKKTIEDEFNEPDIDFD